MTYIDRVLANNRAAMDTINSEVEAINARAEAYALRANIITTIAMAVVLIGMIAAYKHFSRKASESEKRAYKITTIAECALNVVLTVFIWII